MLGRAFGTLAVVAVGATNAFLLPPGVSSTNSPDIVSSILDPNTQTIRLPCSDCLFSTKGEEELNEEAHEDDLFWVQGGARDILLNFTLSEDARAVRINKFQVYPITMDNADEPSVGEVSASISLTEVRDHPEQATPLDVTGASIFTNEELISPAGDKILKIDYLIHSLQYQPVSLDGAEIKLLLAADGTLMILSVEEVPRTHSIFDGMFLPTPPHPTEGTPKECNILPAALCKWKGMLESKLDGFKQGGPHKPGKFGGKGCGGRKGGPHRLPGHIKPNIDHFEEPEHFEHPEHLEKPDDDERPKHHHGRPPHHGHGPHGMHRGPHHHGPHHHFLHRFVRAFISVLVPVIAGITMGLGVSLLGMATGRLIAFLWIKFRRGGQRGYASLAQVEAESNDMEKGDVKFVEEEPLPEYEAAPAYEEEEKKEEEQK